MAPRLFSLPFLAVLFGTAMVLICSTYYDTKLLLTVQQHKDGGYESSGALRVNTATAFFAEQRELQVEAWPQQQQPPPPPPQRAQETPTTMPTLHVLYGLAGAAPDFLDEFEVSLKSLLLNAPLDADLDVHLIVDRAARDDVTRRIRLAELEGSLWRSRVALRLYVVSNITTYRMQRHFESVLPFG